MQPTQILRLAAVSLLLTAGFPLLPAPDLLLSAVAQTVRDRKAEDGGKALQEADRLLQQGTQHLQNSQYRDAKQSLEISVKLYRQISDRTGEARSLIGLGKASLELGNNTQTLELIQQAVAIAKELKNSEIENSARQVLEPAAKIAKAKQDKEEAERLDTQALEQLFKGELRAAYQSSQQALAIYRALKDRHKELGVLESFAVMLHTSSASSGREYETVVTQYYEQALALARELQDREAEKRILEYISLSRKDFKGYCRIKIEDDEQMLATARKLQDKKSEISTLGSLGGCYSTLQEYAKAAMYYDQRLALARKFQNSPDKNDVLMGLSEEGLTLDGLGQMYSDQGDYAMAIEYHQRHLNILNKIIFEEKDDSDYLRTIPLSSTGYALQQQNQPELAILFYKQAVSIHESARQSLRESFQQWEQSEFQPSNFDHAFHRWGQETIVQNDAPMYRRLADLLLQQNRVMEAMQVLDLLKVQELQDYLKDIKGNQLTAQGLPLLQQERELVQAFKQNPAINQTATSPAVTALVTQLRQTAAAQNLTLPAYKDLQARIQKLGKNIALFYPLILDDRLELVLFIPDRPPIRKTVMVKRAEFEREIGEFRKSLPDLSAMPKIRKSAQQLHTWLVQPIDAELKAAKVQTIVYAPDGQMRYVPLAALHDGAQWLTERYQINYLTALALTPINAPDARSPSAFTGALTQGRTITVAGNAYSFGPLTYTQAEVNQIAKTIPNTKSLIDQPFNRKNLLAQMPQASIVHLATHAKFGGTPEESFIVLGDGDVVTLREIEAWKLPNVSLFVLSACETGLGGKLGNGLEILGFGYQMQRTGSRAAIASLWAVQDDGTSVLMSKFYAALQKGNSKAEALRQAQIELINDGNYRHPLYWAPFILIGNGL